MFGMFRREPKTLSEKMRDALSAYLARRYTYRVDLNHSLYGTAPHALLSSESIQRVERDMQNGMGLREALVKQYQGELLRLMLKAAGERGPSRREYGEQWQPFR